MKEEDGPRGSAYKRMLYKKQISNIVVGADNQKKRGPNSSADRPLEEIKK